MTNDAHRQTHGQKEVACGVRFWPITLAYTAIIGVGIALLVRYLGG